MICICGHILSDHLGKKEALILEEYGQHWCRLCYMRVDFNALHTFKRDNLKYLEDLYEKRHKAISL
jgi:hypothetical protein